MEENKSKLGLITMLIAAGLVGGLVVGALPSLPFPIPRDMVYIYPVKFVCGIMPNASSTAGVNPSFIWAVNPGRYTTSINIQNAGATSTTILKKIMLAPR